MGTHWYIPGVHFNMIVTGYCRYLYFLFGWSLKTKNKLLISYKLVGGAFIIHIITYVL